MSYSTDEQISGFQFEITGIDIINVYGGEAGYAGFTINTADNIVLGYTLSGLPISGAGVLVVIDYEGSGMACLSTG